MTLRISPLHPIERNGLRGFGFSLHFDRDTPSARVRPAALIAGEGDTLLPSSLPAPFPCPALSADAHGHPSTPSPDARVAGPGSPAVMAQSGQAMTHSPEREPGNPEVSAISATRVSSEDSRPAACDPSCTSEPESPVGAPIREGGQ